MSNVHVLRLGLYRQGFYDPDSRLYLTKVCPQGEIPADKPLPKAIKTALASGSLIDVNGTIDFRETAESPIQNPPDPVDEIKTPKETKPKITEEAKAETTAPKKGAKSKKE